jgi:hypothetical protein
MEGNMPVSKKALSVVVLASLLLVFPARPARAQGHWEFGVHYGSWGLNLVKGVIDKAVSGAIKQPMLDQIKGQYPDAVENHADTSSDFDSGGSNYGFEARWYPGGTEGSFSIGLSVEKTSMRIEMKQARADISVSYTDENGKYVTAGFNGAGSGRFDIHPLSFNLSFRWDIFPKAVVHPYVTFGLGIASGGYLDEGTLTYDVHGDLINPDGTTEHFPSEGESGSGTKTLAQLRHEAETDPNDPAAFPVWFVPFVQLHLGLKARITPHIHFLVDAGIWDGFLLRAGLAVRI